MIHNKLSSPHAFSEDSRVKPCRWIPAFPPKADQPLAGAGMTKASLAFELSRAGLMKNQPGMTKASLAFELSRAGLMKNQPGMTRKAIIL